MHRYHNDWEVNIIEYEESTKIELKSEVTADLKKEVIALANTDGGTIYIGIDNNGQVVGVSNPDEVMTQVGNMIRDGIKPDLTAYTTIEVINEANARIICITVLRGVKRPYHLTGKVLSPSAYLFGMWCHQCLQLIRRFDRCCAKAMVWLLINHVA